MNQTRTIRAKVPLAILSLIAFVFIALGCLSYFIPYTYNYYEDFTFRFSFPSLRDLLYFFADITPCLLLVLFVLFLHKIMPPRVASTIIFGLLTLSPLVPIAESIIEGYSYDMLSYLIYFTRIIVLSLAVISVSVGFCKKLFPSIAIGTELLSILYYIFNFISSISFHFKMPSLVTYPLWYIGNILFYITLLVFVLANINLTPAKKLTPEESLRLLDEKRNLGIITEAEYQAQRAEIIRNL